MKELIKVLIIVSCGVLPISIALLAFDFYATSMSDSVIYTITIGLIFYYAWFVSVGVDWIVKKITN
jgi:hypothetical protein